MTKLLIHHFKQLLTLLLSFTLVLTSIHPLCARGFLAVPGSNELVSSMVERGLSSVSVVDMGSSKQIIVSLLSETGATLEEQARNILSSIDKVLKENGFDKDSVVKQNIFLKDISHKEHCKKILKAYYGETLPATGFIHQPPIHGESMAVEITAVKGEDVHINRKDEHITIVESDGIRWAYVGGVEPDENIEDTYEQALNCWEKMNRILEENGFNFKQVVRTWIYERELFRNDEDGIQRYDKFNKAREEFFKKVGIFKDDLKEKRMYPASTGIGMSSGSFVMECTALSTKRGDVTVIPLENPDQVSSFRYTEKVLGKGASRPLFSRGMAVRIGNKKRIFVSGTASVKKEDTEYNIVGQQTETTIDNVSGVLEQGGAGVRDITQLRVYIKDIENYETVKTIVERRFPSVPCLYLKADVCRENLLVEIEAEAFVSLIKQPFRDKASKRNTKPTLKTGNTGSKHILISH